MPLLHHHVLCALTVLKGLSSVLVASSTQPGVELSNGNNREDGSGAGGSCNVVIGGDGVSGGNIGIGGAGGNGGDNNSNAGNADSNMYNGETGSITIHALACRSSAARGIF